MCLLGVRGRKKKKRHSKEKKAFKGKKGIQGKKKKVGADLPPSEMRKRNHISRQKESDLQCSGVINRDQQFFFFFWILQNY